MKYLLGSWAILCLTGALICIFYALKGGGVELLGAVVFGYCFFTTFIRLDDLERGDNES